MDELETLRQKLLAEIKQVEDDLKSPLEPWDPNSGEVSPMVTRRHRNKELVELLDLYDRCFPDPKQVLETLRERYHERPLY